MRTVDWLRRHDLAAFFGITFVISWGAVLAVILPTVGFPAPVAAFSTQGGVFAASVFALLLGPPIASLVMRVITKGTFGIGARRPPTPARYWAMALIAPVSLFAVLAVLSSFDPAYRPGIWSASAPAMAMGLVYAFGAGIFEELGWTGFATPRLIERYGTTRGAILLGVIWTVWHVLPIFTFTAKLYGPLYLASFVQSLVFLTAFRVVMTLVYERTRNLYVNQVLHFSLTASSILVAPSTTPEKAMIWNSLWPMTLAGVAMVMVVARAATARRLRNA